MADLSFFVCGDNSLENDIFQFTRKIRLTNHYWNSNIVDESIVKLESTYTAKPNENADLENICKELEHTKISLFKTKHNLHKLRKGLDSLIQFVIFKPLSYCFKETIGFDVKASFASRL